MMKRLVSVLVCAAVILVSGMAAAQDEAVKAKEHFRQGQALYKEGKFKEAIEELKRAYALKPIPALLLNIAQTYRKLNDTPTAIDYYKRYLEFSPNAPNAGDIKALIAELEGTAKGNPPPVPTAPPATELPAIDDSDNPLASVKRKTTEVKSSPYRVWKWVTLSAGVAMLGAGIGLNRAAASKQSDLEKAARVSRETGGPNAPAYSFSMYKDLESSGKTYATSSGVMFGIGGALAVTGAILFILDSRYSTEDAPKKKSTLGVAPTLAPGLMGLTGAFQF